MSNYTITTDFGAKDSLPSSNSAKVVRGSEFTTEFTNIQTAIATKADTAGNTFTGVVNFSADVAVNTNTLFVDVSEAEVGIGTASPDTLLHVYGTGSGNGTYGAQITIGKNNGCKISSTQESADDDVQGLAFFTKASNQVSDSAVERLRIDSSGNVGIGTTNPSAKLHVEINDNTAYSSANMLNGTIAQYIFNTSDTDGTHAVLGFGVDGTSTDAQAAIGTTYTDAGDGALVMGTRAGGNVTERMRIDSSGNVGIGTTSPASKLHVQDSTGSPQIRIDNQGTGSGIASLMFHGGGTGNPTSIIQSGGADSGNVGIIFKHGNHGSETERMRIGSTGRVAIGGTATSANNLTLHNASAAELDLDCSGGTRYRISSENDSALKFKDSGANAERMRIDSSGNVLVGKQAVEMAAVGVEVKPAGEVRITSDDVFGLQLNRKTGDGEIINLRKDGSAVGSIGAVSGDIRIGGSDDNHAGIRFAASTKSVIPVKNTDGDLSDNTTDLGASNSRFKDLLPIWRRIYSRC